MSITYKPSRRKRKRAHGFLRRGRRSGGQRTLRQRRRKGRYRLTV